MPLLRTAGGLWRSSRPALSGRNTLGLGPGWDSRSFSRLLGLLLLLPGAVLVLVQPALGAFVFEGTGNLASARQDHTATLLPDGKVLVVGGEGSSGNPLASAQLYDPASGSWGATGSLSNARKFHTATLLRNGKVLVAGGRSGDDALASAELYDPVSGTWTTTGSLLDGRRLHTATLLPSGKVLIAGGYSGSRDMESAELYDPATGSWASTGSLSAARRSQTATLLPSGEVLVVGGFGISYLASAELYNPASGSWTSTGSLATARISHMATLLPNGKVLVAGGRNNTSGASLASAELYDPATGSWASTDALATARRGQTATLLPSGKVLVTGGLGSGDTYLASAEVYDPAGVMFPAGGWTTTGSLATARDAHTATLLPNGKVLVVGGVNGGSNPLASAELYDSASGSWKGGGTLAAARFSHTATSLPNGRVLVAGGATSALVTSDYLASAELYDPLKGKWAGTGSLATGRRNHTATLLPGGQVLVVGGEGSFGGDALASAELYDAASGSWTATGSLGTGRYYHTATLLPGGTVLVTGGRQMNGVDFASAELYDPASGSWIGTGSLATLRSFHTATLLPSGKVLVAGGYNDNDVYLNSAELYDPATGTWTAGEFLTTTRSRHSATLLFNGKVLVAGGYGFDGDLNSAELYDPASGSWTATGSLATKRYEHPATLLSNGKVLVAGGRSGHAQTSADLYDPASGSWTVSDDLAAARTEHTATLLPNNGRVLVAGGLNTVDNNAISSAELYDVGLGFSAAWQPQISATSSSFLHPGGVLTLSGARFNGISQASGGNFQDSSSNHPVVQLRRIDNGQVIHLLAESWSERSFTSTPVSGFPFGPAFVTIFTNGIPSDSEYLVVRPASPAITTQASGATQIGGSISDSATLTNGVTPSGTITFTLFGPDSATCGDAPIFTSTVAVNGNGTYSSGSFTPVATGTYYWIASYSGDANNDSATGACNDPNESVVVSTEPASPARFANISTRLRVETGDNVLIGGFIITGTQAKKIIVRGIGTSLPFVDRLENPTLELRDGSGALLDSNDNWIDSPNKQAIIDSTIPPSNDLESAIVATVPADNSGYTAIVRGVEDGTGIGVVEAYDLDSSVDSKLANISTRGLVQTGDNVLIAGTIITGQSSQNVLVRAIGPSLPVPGKLEDPTLELRDGNGGLLAENDNWRSHQEAEIIATTIPPTNDLESAIVATLSANNASYTAIVRGVNNTTGIAVVEVYALP